MNTTDENIEALLGDLLEPFTHISYGFVAFLLLLSLAIFSSLVLRRRAQKVKTQIQEAIAALSNVKDEQDFSERFGKISSDLGKIALIRHAWSEFEETLIPPLLEVDDPAYRVFRNTKRPQEFFNSQTVFAGVQPIIGSERLIGFGLLLTFLGLVAALTKASGVFTGSGQGDITKAMAELLSTAGAKFLASIGGLLGSIIQSMFESYTKQTLDRELGQFNELLERHLSFASQERILADQYGHSQRQTARLEEMGTEITLALGNQLKDSIEKIPTLMGKEFQDALKPMQQHFEEVTNRMAQGSDNTVADMVSKFSEQLKGASDASMTAVTNQLEGLAATLQSTAKAMESGNSDMRASLQESLVAMRETSETFKGSIGTSADAASNQIATLVKQMQEQQDQSTTAISHLISQFQTAASDADKRMGDAGRESMSQLAKGIEDAIQAVLASTKSTTTALADKISADAAQHAKTTSEAVNKSLVEVTAAIAQAVEPVTNALGAWKDETALVSKNLGTTNSELSRHRQGLEQAGSSIFEAGSAFSKAATDVRVSTEPLANTVQTLKAAAVAIESASTAIGDTNKLIGSQVEQASRSTADSLLELKTLWERHVGHFQGADKQLENAFVQITSNLEASLAVLSQFQTDANDKVGESLENLGSIVQELSEGLEDFNDKRK
jgi:DNA anti-recombination protein RmuC